MPQTDVKPVASITGIQTRECHIVMFAMARDEHNVLQRHAYLDTVNGVRPLPLAVCAGVCLTENVNAVL